MSLLLEVYIKSWLIDTCVVHPFIQFDIKKNH